MTPEIRNQLIIDSILKKEQKLFPGVVSLIGIYGSFLTGDIHSLSDLDLLIVINDERGWQLGSTFIQEDQNIGHDIYCTTWESLKDDAEYTHPNIAKLMDSKIVYAASDQAREELEQLRDRVRKTLDAPFSIEDYERAENEFKNAEEVVKEIAKDIGLADARNKAGWVLYYLENSIALLNKTYFKKGTRRIYDELSSMKRRPENLCKRIDAVVRAEDTENLVYNLQKLIKETGECFLKQKEDLEENFCKKEEEDGESIHNEEESQTETLEAPVNQEPAKSHPDADALRGSYEEMFSNWRGKMVLAAETDNCHLAFVSLASFQAMFDDIFEKYEGIEPLQAFSIYDPTDLQKTLEGFEGLLQEYLKNYKKVGLKPEKYENIEAWAAAYVK